MLNFLAAGVYAVVASLHALATLQIRRRGFQPPSWVTWSLLAIFFAGFALWRLLDVEAAVEQALRGEMFGRGGYYARDQIQRPLVVVVLVSFAFAAAWMVFRSRKRGVIGLQSRYLRRAVYAALALCCLVALRLISFHPIDTLLYSGPHLNRIVEPALVLFAGIQAALSIRQMAS